MPSLTYLTAALAFASTVVATPVSIDKREKFTVHQVQRGTFLKNGAADKVKTLLKYGKAVPKELQTAADNRANAATVSIESNTGSEPANPSDQYDSSYLSPVTIGSTEVQLDFDTGSSDLWVFSSLQAKSQLSGHSYYQATSSKQLQGYTWKISYGDGSGASGLVYADKVTVAGVTATRQAVEAATSVSAQFSQNTDTDGLLGLAFSVLNTVQPQPQKTWFDTVSSQLAKPLFSVNLKYHTAGSYDFGFIDSTQYTGPITYVNADTSQGWWGFSASAYSVGTTTTNARVSGILDTGTTLIYTDDSIVNAYYAKVSGAQFDSTQGGYTFPCSATLPNFSITVGGVKQVVPGKYINYAPVSGSTCFGGIQSDSDIGFSIFGDIFLKSKYIVHDLNNGTPRLGFAQKAGI